MGFVKGSRVKVILNAPLRDPIEYEIISKIQTMRKDADFEVMDHIRVSINGNEKLSVVADKNKDAIAGKVLADELTANKEYAVTKEWNVNGETVSVSMERV